jgi:hypothetical protein
MLRLMRSTLTLDEARVDRRLGYPRSFMQSAWSADLSEPEALLEYIRAELMLDRADGEAKQLCRAAAR